jgi:2'-5' RNA ligase
MEKIRTFVAVGVAPAVTRRAATLVDRLRVSQAEVRWVDADKMHLTLKFLGDVPAVETPQVCQAVADAARGVVPFPIHFRGAGAFPNAQRARTVWLGVDEGLESITKLQRSVDKVLAGLGFPKEHRRFHPHLTLGRVRRGGPTQQELGRLIQEHAKFDGAGCVIDEVLVFASYLDKSGPTYDALTRVRLVPTED